MTFSNAAAIWLTSVQLSASSVPVLSAVYPPNEGITSPPLARIWAIWAPKVALETGMELSPFQYGVQEPLVAVCRNAIVRFLAPDWAARVAGLSPVQASKYGAKIRLGSGVAAWAEVVPTAIRPADAASVAQAATMAWTDLRRRMCVLQQTC